MISYCPMEKSLYSRAEGDSDLWQSPFLIKMSCYASDNIRLIKILENIIVQFATLLTEFRKKLYLKEQILVWTFLK